jgi:short-subunit dehydrogenase
MSGREPEPAIVITGASSGLGREIARLAAADGQPLVLIGRAQDRLDELARELQGKGAAAFPLSADLERPDAIASIDALLLQHNLCCDVLVNSAGFGVFGAVAGTDSKAHQQLIDVNIKATLALSSHYLPGMIARKRGGILNFGSITGFAPGPFMASYCASKAFIRSWSAALSAELAGTGVTVTCVSPGIVRTAFFDRNLMRRSRMTKLLPHGGVTQAARAAWSAFRAGRSHVVPRFIDRFVIGVCWITPTPLLVRFIAALQRTPR